MHQSVVIGPTADAVEPGLEPLKLRVAELAVEFLQQKHGGHFLYQYRAGKKMIGDLDQEVEPLFLPYFPSKTDSGAAQVSGIPASRFGFIFEEPLHAHSMLGGAAAF